jgi:rubrerythrin
MHVAYGKPESGSVQATQLEQLLIWLREDLMGELQAINQYQAHIDNIDNAEIKDLLSHIRDDEKEHVAEITHLISRIDAIQRDKFLNDHTAAPEERVGSEGQDDKIPTIGSMFGQK